MQTLLAHQNKGLPQPTRKAIYFTSLDTVAIIGSTRYLAPHIVASLLRKHAGSKIFCLNRSFDGKQRAVSALRGILGDSVSLSRLQFLVAVIAESSFGLEEKQVTLLASEVSEVVFNAWDTNWALPIEHFTTFLRAIRNAIDFCELSATRIRITFVSLVCAVGNWLREHLTQPVIPEEIV
jgi:thioester reductase-like protein